MNICGVLVHSAPARTAEVEAALRAMDGVEVHHVTTDHRLIITVEDTGLASAAEQNLAIHRIPGVLSAALVYHHFEEPEAA
ncbi:MAG: chaperone NapD [Geminicoccaceae bacterium]